VAGCNSSGLMTMKILLNWLLLLVLAANGCASKSKARAEAQAAYNAGQAAAYRQALEQQRTSIRVVGNVRNPEIPWTNGLSLMEAIIQADCTDRGTPREIILFHKNEPQPIRIDMKAFLKGEDMLLEPGDTIEIHP
jgi:hypothetical protein